jgi:hypothetical protein
MISHFNLGTNNLEAAEVFFDELLKVFGGKQGYKSERTIFYMLGDIGANLAIKIPFDGKPATGRW